jgi:hypothetical protein
MTSMFPRGIEANPAGRPAREPGPLVSPFESTVLRIRAVTQTRTAPERNAVICNMPEL